MRHSILSSRVALVRLPPSGMMDRGRIAVTTTRTIDKADEAQLFATIDRWVEREVAPRVKEFDHADRWPAELVEQMKELGLFGATVDPEYGGLGLPARTYAEIVMKISSVWMAITGIFNSHLMLALAIEKFGTGPQKRHWLPRLASGEVRGGLALTEPDAGTDLQAIRLTARRDGDHYVLNGTKTWISNGIEGSCFALLVKTNPDAQPRHSGMSLFIAPKGPGFRVGRKLEKLGYKSIDSAELTMVPKVTVDVADEAVAKRLMKLMDALEDNDDVQEVFANFDIPEEILEAIAG